MITYILQTITFQLVFLAFYELILKKETFFQWNRVYLLITPTIALLLPFIKIGALQSAVPHNLIMSLPEIIIGTTNAAAQNNMATASLSLSLFEIILLVGMIISTLLFFWKIYRIIRLKQKGKLELIENTIIVRVPKSTDAFSFVGTIFLGENINQKNKEYILAHEQVHIRQKHYLDLLYFEVLRIVFWFNPLVYLFQKRTATLHEYIADAKVVSQSDKPFYYQNLLSQVFQTQSVSFINTFFKHSLIKKRIVMLHKSKSKKTQQLKYVLLIPVITLMLIFSSYSPQETQSIKAEPQQQEQQTVPFAQIDQGPIYSGCENVKGNEDQKICFVENISQLVSKNFNTSIAKNSGLSGKQRIAVQFKIDAQGNVVDIMSRAPNSALGEEAKRVINLIPQMQPGKQEGKNVAVIYSLPIVFEVKN